MKHEIKDPGQKAAFDRCIDVMTKLVLKYGSKVLKGLQTIRYFVAPSSLRWLRGKEMNDRLQQYWDRLKKVHKSAIDTLCSFSACAILLSHWGDDGRNSMDKAAKIVELRKSTGMNRKEFCEYFKIPYRTMSEWERDGRHAPDYLVLLLEYYIRVEMLKQKGSVSDPDAEMETESGGNNNA